MYSAHSRTMCHWHRVIFAAGSALAASPTPNVAARAQASPPPAGVVSHVKVLSQHVEDVSSLEAWKRAVLRPGMTHQEKALAVWEAVVKFRHQDPPPNEFLQDAENVHDAIKTFNVYGYGMCCCASANIQQLARAAGLPARGRIISSHSVPEVFWDGAWHLLDGSLVNYFPKADGSVAGVDELIAGVKGWYSEHPELRGNDRGLRQFMRGGGWKQGPAILANSPFYDRNGWLPAATHGWYSTMQEYDGAHDGVFEYGYSQGYQVNVQLREGERLTRNWSNRGLHINMAEGDAPGVLKGVVGQDELRYAPRYGDLAPGRIGNGTLEYDVPLAGGTFRGGSLQAENLACGAEDGRKPAVRVADPARPGLLVLRIPSSYVYLGGTVTLTSVVPSGGRIRVSLSDNHGLDWKPVAEVRSSGAHTIELKPLVYRRYDYRLRLALEGAGTGLDALRIRHDVQHSQRALPALAEGENRIAFSAGPPEGTITIEGNVNPDRKGKQLVYTDFRPQRAGVGEPHWRVTGAEGSVTFPLETPGDLTRIRFGAHYRARDLGDGWDLQISFDDGKSFRTAGRCAGPTAGNSHYVVFDQVPPGIRKALVRFAGRQRNTTCLFDFRIDADYREPRGGFAPVKVTYVWEESGQEKRHTHVAREPLEQYTIRCRTRPVMSQLILERAP